MLEKIFLKSNFTPEERWLLEELDGRIGSNCDFISLKTYESIFSKFDLKNKRIFDLGAGFLPISPQASEYIAALPSQNLNLIPVEINELRIRSWNLAKMENANPSESTINPVRGDMFKLPFPDESFDGGVSINVINNFRKLEAVPALLEEIRRVLKPGGFLILSSFGYYKCTKEGQVFYNNDFKENEIITSNLVQASAELVGFSRIERIPLDPAKIKAEAIRKEEIENRKSSDKTKVEMVEPFGLLLRR